MDEEFLEISDDEKEETKYLSIFDNTYQDVDELVITIEDAVELKKWRALWLRVRTEVTIIENPYVTRYMLR